MGINDVSNLRVDYSRYRLRFRVHAINNSAAAARPIASAYKGRAANHYPAPSMRRKPDLNITEYFIPLRQVNCANLTDKA